MALLSPQPSPSTGLAQGVPEGNLLLPPVQVGYRSPGPREASEESVGWSAGCNPSVLSACLQAALDFVVEEDLKAHLTCWYIQKYVKENPLPQYLEHLQP